MSFWRYSLVAVGLFCWALPGSAILIETKEGKVGGYLKADDGTKLTIIIRTPDGREKPEVYTLAKITVLHRMDVKRLERLSPDNPKAYRDYADELAAHKDDPEARDTAMRLYLIAASLAREKFGTSCLLSMSTVASTPAEARKCRAMAYLLDPKADPELLKTPAVKPAGPGKLPGSALGDFTKAMQHYRLGRINLAVDTAKHDGVDKLFALTPDRFDQKTFLQWCADSTCKTCKDGKVSCPNCKGSGVVMNPANPFGGYEKCPTCGGTKRVTCPDCGGTHIHDPPDEVLRVVLRSELWALEQQGAADPGRKEATDPRGWSSVMQSRRLNPVLPLSLETITEFDPHKCRYRNGRWVEDSAP
jgi:hypothetical protein